MFKLNSFCPLVQEEEHVFYVFIVKGTVFQTLPKCGTVLALLKVCL